MKRDAEKIDYYFQEFTLSSTWVEYLTIWIDNFVASESRPKLV